MASLYPVLYDIYILYNVLYNVHNYNTCDSGTMKLKHTEGQVQVILTNIHTHDKITLEAVASGEPDDQGDTLFTYQTWSPPNQVT